ncbi:hypothetical protein BH09BAC4_BH09BAC4_06940 [soil metagenome]
MTNYVKGLVCQRVCGLVKEVIRQGLIYRICSFIQRYVHQLIAE